MVFGWNHFRVALNLIMKARQSAKFFRIMKISFHSYANKTNSHMKSFAVSLAFIIGFTATRKWPIKIVFRISSPTNSNDKTHFAILLSNF